MQLFYNPLLNDGHKHCLFSPEESKHLVSVSRKTEGDPITITNGKGLIFEAEIVIANPKQCKAHINTIAKIPPKHYTLHLAVAPTKMNDRYIWFLEKATEIGVDEITPLICHHSERKTLKPERMERVLQAALKQSFQAYLPKLNPVIAYHDFMAQEIQGLKYMAHCLNGEKWELKEKIIPNRDITILIGPEGDFSTAEVDLALQKNFVPVSLGKNRLRTETAALVACTTVAVINR